MRHPAFPQECPFATPFTKGNTSALYISRGNAEKMCSSHRAFFFLARTAPTMKKIISYE